jgi:hypothetical protein
MPDKKVDSHEKSGCRRRSTATHGSSPSHGGMAESLDVTWLAAPAELAAALAAVDQVATPGHE